MDSAQQDYIKKLYTRFREESSNGNPSTVSYSEEELLDIFDYAGDVGDDFTQLLVLLKAHVEYPDDEELLERKGIFATFITGGNILTQDFLDKHTHESPLWDLMRIFNMKADAPTTRLLLDKLINRYSELDDETVIRLVDVVAELNQFDWFVENLELLKTRVMYPETLLHEAVEECIDRGLSSRAIELLSELTEIAPFDALYWRLLAQQYLECDNLEAANTAIDYALAIDATDLMTQLLKAQITFDLKPNHGDALSTMKRIFEENRQDSTVAFFYVQMLTLVGRSSDSLPIIEAFLNDNPQDLQMIQGAMLIHDPILTERVLNKYLDVAVGLDDNAVQQYADHLTTVKCPLEAVTLQLLWYRRTHSDVMLNDMLPGLYRYNCYESISDIIVEKFGEFPTVDLTVMDATNWAMALLALMRVESRRYAALSLAASFTVIDLSQLNISDRLATTAAVAIAVTATDMLGSHPDGISEDDISPIDPFFN